MTTLHVAALQFASGCDKAQNLQTCLRMIDQAATHKVDLMVLPEFCNRLSWYQNREQAWQEAVSCGDDFYQAIASKAKTHRCYIVINVSYRRSYPDITVTSLVFDPSGACVAECDKQTLMGAENRFFTRASQISPIVSASFGRFSAFACRDGVTFETARCLTLRGASLLCDSLNSFAFDEASLHIPARAIDNGVFVVSANKVGALLPEPDLSQLAAETGLKPDYFYGAGQSQIISPQGEILATAGRSGEAIITAHIDLADSINGAAQPFSTNRPPRYWPLRRPELYAAITQPPRNISYPAASEQVTVAMLQPTGRAKASIESLPELLAQLSDKVALCVLPALFWQEPNVNEADNLALSAWCEHQIQHYLATHAPRLLVACSILEPQAGGVQHLGVILSAKGRLHQQAQLHAEQDFEHLRTGEQLDYFDSPFGRLVILVGEDASSAELCKVSAIEGCHIALLLPHAIQRAAEKISLASRAVENRLCVLACVAQSSPISGLVADLEQEFTILTNWQHRQFDGNINVPLLTEQHSPVLEVTIHPLAAQNKLLSFQSDLIAQRPWQLSTALVE